MSFSKRLSDFCKGLKTAYLLSKSEKAVIRLFKKEFTSPSAGSKCVLVQMPEDYSFFIKFAFVANYFAKFHNARILGYSNRITAVTKRSSIKSKITTKMLYNSMTDNKWLKLYSSFGLLPGFKNSNKVRGKENEILQLTESIFKNLKDKSDIYQININGIDCGDLIYDTYLRFKPDVTLDISDIFLKHVIQSAVEVNYTVNQFLDHNQVECVLSPYTSYIHHGMPVRVFLQRGIKVYTFCYPDYFILQVYKDFPLHVTRHIDYRKKFAVIDNKQEKLAMAAEKLQNRLSGQKDSALYFMKESPFSKNYSGKALKESGRKRVVIMLHCFYDSPNVYRYLIFPDFWEWITQTLNVLVKMDIDVYLKPHPNGAWQNGAILDKLQNMYPEVTVLKKVSNSQLIEEGISAVITVYGTCACEFPYYGIPVLNAADNPHIDYNFSVTPKTKEEYFSYLAKITELPLPEKDQYMAELFEFFYMHNIYIDKGRIEEKNVFGIDQYFPVSGTPALLTKFLESKPDLQKIKSLVKKACESCEGA